MAGFNPDTGYGDIDQYSTIGAGGYYSVSTDVSMGAPDEQPYTPTGNGTGVFLDTVSQNGIFGALDKVLNYALYKDQQKMTQVAMPVQQAQLQASQAAAADGRILKYALIGGLIYFGVTMAGTAGK